LSKRETLILTGNYAVAYAVKYARVKVVAAYPITPQTTIVEKIAELVERGELDAEYIRVESEHSALAACIGAESAGVRTFTATSAHGLAYMHEGVWWAAGARLPIVMAIVSRAMGPGWSIWTDYCDILSQRDLGWIQIYCADNQEVFNSVIQAYKICEDSRVHLPCMVNLEAFILSHTSMPVSMPSQEEIDEFLPSFKPQWIIDVNNPITHGNIVSPEWYMEFRYMIQEAMENAKKVIPEVEKEYARKFGFEYKGFIEEYMCDDAEIILMSMGSIGCEAKIAVNNLRKRGIKAGIARLRVFRPFPNEEIRKLAENTEMIAVIDRSISFGMEGVLLTEVKSSLYGYDKNPLCVGFIVGLGGRDVTYKDVEKMGLKAYKWLKRGKIEKETVWYGIKR